MKLKITLFTHTHTTGEIFINMKKSEKNRSGACSTHRLPKIKCSWHHKHQQHRNGNKTSEQAAAAAATCKNMPRKRRWHIHFLALKPLSIQFHGYFFITPVYDLHYFRAISTNRFLSAASNEYYVRLARLMEWWHLFSINTLNATVGTSCANVKKKSILCAPVKSETICNNVNKHNIYKLLCFRLHWTESPFQHFSENVSRLHSVYTHVSRSTTKRGEKCGAKRKKCK